MVVITRWLDAESDAEAIRKAIKIQKRLETGLSNMTAGAQDALMLEAVESMVGIPDAATDALASLLNMTRDELLAGIDEEE